MSARTATYGRCAVAVRATIAAYAQAVDDGRTADIVATFCPDGSVRLPGSGEVRGHPALHALYSAQQPASNSRHLVMNVQVTSWTPESASAISDLVVVRRSDQTGWGVRTVGRYLDTLHPSEFGWRFHSRTLERAA